MFTTIVIDEENSGEAFWTAARTAPGPDDPAEREVWRQILAMDLSVYAEFPSDILAGVEAYAATLPGWADGPDYAPHPWFHTEPIDGAE